MTNCNNGEIKIGCTVASFSWWGKYGPGLARESGYTPAQVREYREYLKLFKKFGR